MSRSEAVTARWQHSAIWLSLIAIAVAGLALRSASLEWLIGAGPSPSYSFHPDDARFILTASHFEQGPLGGYPNGMATHVFLLDRLPAFIKAFGEGNFQALLEASDSNLAILLRAVTLAYAALTVPLTYLVARTIGCSRGVGLLASALIAVTPLHVVNSHFGTADITVVWYFYTSLLVGGAYLRTGRQPLFIAFVVLCGVTLAIKFFIPVAAALAVTVLFDPYRDWKTQGVLALLVAFVSFEAFQLFNYNLWDFARLMKLLIFDNVTIGGEGLSAGGQVREYALESVPALGLPVAALVVVGLFLFTPSLVTRFRRLSDVSQARHVIRTFLRSPTGLIAVSLTFHALLILSVEVHVPRHLLVFVPVACVLAAATLARLANLTPLPAIAAGGLVVAVFGYQLHNDLSIRQLYRSDVRGTLAKWAESRRAAGENVATLSGYSRVRGSDILRRHEAVVAGADNFVTCDLEFARYVKHDDASKVFHPKGQARLEFFRALFAGRLPFKIEAEFNQAPLGFEQKLIYGGTLPAIGTFVPWKCYAFARVAGDGAPRNVTEPASAEVSDH